jgi:hypothetical protein
MLPDLDKYGGQIGHRNIVVVVDLAVGTVEVNGINRK